MRLGRLSVKARLRGGFVFVGMLTGLLGLIALDGLFRLAQLTTDLYEHPFTVNTTVIAANGDLIDIAATMKDLISAHGSDLDDDVYRLGGKEFEVDRAVDTMRQRYLGDQADLDALQKTLATWRSIRDLVIAQVRGNQRLEAQSLLRATGEPLIAAAQKSLHDISVVSASKAKQFAMAAAEQRDEVLRSLYLSFAAIAVVGILVTTIVYKSVTDQLNALRGAMVKLAAGNHDLDIPEQGGGGIIGEMATTIEVFKRSAIHLSSENWIKTNIAELSTAMQQADHPKILGQMVVSRLVPLTGAGAGVFYLWRREAELLELIASYGFSEHKGVAHSYRLGEGLVGQCGLEKEVINLTEVPGDYLRITSSLGEAPPRAILVAPLLSKGALMGVIEIATFTPLSQTVRDLIDQLLPVVGLNLELIEHARSTRLLLEETQRQAQELQASEEELKTQSDELQATNEELRAKSDALMLQTEELRASEEELRAQREELQATNEELMEKSQTLVERQKALEAARDESERHAVELEVASHYKSEFLANMSHELRTPLNSLLILAKTLVDNEERTLTGEQVESARIIYEGGIHLLELINDILDLSKVEAGKMVVILEDIHIPTLAQSIKRRFAGLAGARRLSLTVEVDPELPAAMRCDPGKLDQIINNLVSNALKFTRQGGVTVRLSRSPRLPSGGPTDRAGEALAVAVIDTGIGIAADKQERIFRAFEQADGTTSRQYGGTGLGLSISQKLAELLNGEVTLSSIEGKGSTFTLYLPLITPADAPAEQPPAEAVEVPAAVRPSSLKDDQDELSPGDAVILVIEDDEAFARILYDMARQRGFKCVRAADGRTGLDLAQRVRPAGILLDIALPEMDGWAVMTQLKQMPDLRHVPVHFISVIDDRVRGLQMGAAGYLKKPVTRAQIDGVFDRLRHFAGDEPRRVLIVDDDAASRRSTATLVQGERIDIVEAGMGGEALALLRDQRFDCMVLDLLLPDFSGFDLLDQATREQIPLPPVVVYSGKDLSYEETLKLREYTDSIVIKGARSPERLVDEVSLFLHSVQASQPADSQASRRPSVPTRDKDLAGRVVLLVDDDMRNAFALSKVLRGRGLKVIIAQDGKKALAHLKDNPEIELVLMDVMMPGMDGYSCMKEIRKNPQLKSLPILAVTAKAMTGDKERCLAAGADDYLSKPIDVDALVERLRRHLGMEPLPA
jgi:CheY-like chemotaxis protein/signal transduction histidine kinase